MVKNNLKTEKINISSTHLETITIKLTTQSHTIYHITGIYRPPSLRVNTRNYLINDLKKLSKLANPIIVGDFNAKSTDWNCINNNWAGNAIKQFVNGQNLKVMAPPSPTYLPKTPNHFASTIDFAITTSIIKLKCSNIMALNIFNSDHNPFIFELNDKHYDEPIKFTNYSKCDWHIFKKLITKK